MIAQTPITKANRYKPMFRLSNFFPCVPRPLAKVQKLKTTLPKAGSKVVRKKLANPLIGFTIKNI